MEPRGCIGIFEPTEQRYTIYTTLQRTNVFQTELSQYVLKVPDNKIRVVAMYSEGKINDAAAFGTFLKKPLDQTAMAQAGN